MHIRWMAKATLILVVALLATPAFAQTTINMGGDWFSNRGPLIDIPVAGGPELRIPALNGKPCFAQTGCFLNFKPQDGGLVAPITVGAAAVSVMTNGTATPATFTIPPALFEFNTAMNVGSAAVVIVPTVVSLTTNFYAAAPGSPGISAMSWQLPNATSPTTTLTQILNPQTVVQVQQLGTSMGTPTVMSFTISGPPAVNRRLRQDAWMTQTGRGMVGADFSFCRMGQGGLEAQGTHLKDGAVLGCTTPQVGADLATLKAYNGIMTYTAGPNRFGGTMMMLLDGGGAVFVINGNTATTSMGVPGTGVTPKVCASPIGAPGAAGLRNQNTGAGFLMASTAVLPPGPCYRGMIQTPGQKIATLGPLLPPNIITTPGGAMFDLNELPENTNLNQGGPWTTGTLFEQQTGTVDGQDVDSTITIMGSHMTNGAGEGNITLVAGSLSHRPLAGTNTTNFGYIRMVTFNAPEPGASLMLGVALVGIAGAYLVIRRRSVA